MTAAEGGGMTVRGGVVTAGGWGWDYWGRGRGCWGRGCHALRFSLVQRLLHSVFEHLPCASLARSAGQKPMC